MDAASKNADRQGATRSPAWHHAVVGSFAILLALLPFLRILTIGPGYGMYNAIASDTYYYLRLADAFATGGTTSFDGQTSTNGYNPAWQVLLIALALITGAAARAPEFMVQVVFLVSMALSAGGSLVLSLSLLRAFGLRAALLMNLILVPGVFFLLFDQSYKKFGDPGLLYSFSSWSFGNGMESGLGFLFWAVAVGMLFRFFRAPDRPDSFFFWLGAVCFLIAFSRLDDVFWGVAVFLGIAPYLVSRRRVRAMVAFGLVPVAGFAAYVVFNLTVFDAALPVSGMSKTSLFSFPTPLATLREFDARGYLAQRALPMCILLGFGAVMVIVALTRRPRDWRWNVIAVLAGYLVLKYLFLFSSVEVFGQGYWYYTLGIASFNLICALCLAGPLVQIRGVAFAAALGLGLVVVVATALHFDRRLYDFTDRAYTRVWHHLCANGRELQDKIAAAARSRGLEYRGIDTGDGAAAYCLDLPSISLTGLADSVEVLDERAEKGLLQAAYDRGYRLIVENDAIFGSYFDRQTVAGEGFVLEPIFTDELLVVFALQRPGEPAANQ